MKKTIHLFLLITSFYTVSFSQKNTASANPLAVKLGYLEVDSVLVKLKESPAQVKILEAYQKQLNAAYDFKKLELDTQYKGYQEKEKTMTEEQKKSMSQEIIKMDQELQEFTKDAQQKTSQKQNDLLVPMYEKISKAIGIVAKNNSYTHIADKKNFYFVSPYFDVTDLVTEEANK